MIQHPRRAARNKSRYGATMDPGSYENYLSRDSSVNSLLKYARRQAEQFVSALDDATPAPDHYYQMKDLMGRRGNLGVSKYKNQPTYPMFRRTD